jgi:hypothetical protein
MTKILNQTKVFNILKFYKLNLRQYYILYKLYIKEELTKKDLEISNQILEYIIKPSTGKIYINPIGMKIVEEIEECFFLLKKPILNEKEIDELRYKINSSISMARKYKKGSYRLKFGKYQGRQLIDIPLNYLQWLAKQSFCPDPVKTFVLSKKEMINK